MNNNETNAVVMAVPPVWASTAEIPQYTWQVLALILGNAMRHGAQN